MTVRRFFLDESGHSGDLVRPRAALDFAGQPIFALACVGVGDEPALLAELERLRRVHRVGGAELKSGALKARLPGFGGDLARFLVQQDWPVFVELVDKRFFVAIHIVNHLLCGGMGTDQVDMFSRALMAESICDDATAPLQAYVAACDAATVDGVRTAVDALLGWADTAGHPPARLVQVLARHAGNRLEAVEADPIDFLPIADTGPGGKRVWMLPNLQCLTNVYARLNQCFGEAIDGVELVHDEQLQYGQILEDAKALMETLADESLLSTPFADYRLRGRATLAFASSAAEPCIQAADIIVGFAMRFLREVLGGTDGVDSSARAAFGDLLEACDPVRATGVNLVMTQRDLHRAGIPVW